MIVSPCLPATPGPWCVAAIGREYRAVPEEVADREGAVIVWGSMPSKAVADRVLAELVARDRGGRRG